MGSILLRLGLDLGMHAVTILGSILLIQVFKFTSLRQFRLIQYGVRIFAARWVLYPLDADTPELYALAGTNITVLLLFLLVLLLLVIYSTRYLANFTSEIEDEPIWLNAQRFATLHACFILALGVAVAITTLIPMPLQLVGAIVAGTTVLAVVHVILTRYLTVPKGEFMFGSRKV